MPTSDSQTFVNLVNLCLGAGVLSFPWSFAGASVGGGLIIVALGICWCSITNVVIAAFAERSQRFTLGHMLAELPNGKILEPLGNFMVLACSLLCLVGYLVVFSDNAQTVVVRSLWGSDVSNNPMTRRLLVLIGCLIVFPLAFLDQSRLAFTSWVSVAANWYICIILVVEAASADQLSTVCVFGMGVGDFTLVPVVMMAVSVQQCIPPMYEEMENRTVKNFIAIQTKAAIVSFLMLSVVSISGYLMYGADVPSDILVALPRTPRSLLAQASILPVVISVYPLILYPVSTTLKECVAGRNHRNLLSRNDGSRDRLLPEDCQEGSLIRGSLGDSQEQDRGSHGLLFCLQLGTVAITGLIAATGVDLGPVNDYAGIVGLAWFTVALPGILHLGGTCSVVHGRSSVLVYLHLVFGSVLTLATLLWRGNYYESLERHCMVWRPGRGM